MSPVRRTLTRLRKQLPFEDWPTGDQIAWQGLFQDGDPLEGTSGTARHWSAVTRKNNGKHYGRWLAWLKAQKRLDRSVSPWTRATPEAVTAFARALLREVALEEVAPRTAATTLIGLKCVLQRMAPGEDWAWLKAMTNRLDSWAKPSRQLTMPELPSPELLDIALGELERLSGLVELGARDLWDYRDTFIVALLLACPIRLRNLTMMEPGRHLVHQGDEWHLHFEPHETKTGQPIHLVLPASLDPYLETYLSRIRPAYPGANTHNRVWAAQRGQPMACETLYDRVTKTTARLFETTLSPHAFRTLAATLFAETSPEDSLHARPLLGHRQFTTTEQFYIRASQLRAAQNVSQALLGIRDGELEDLEPEETE